jgi:dienelactone hydrolase
MESMRQTEILTSHRYFQKRFEKISRKLAFQAATTEELIKWRDLTIQTLKQITGYETMEKSPLFPRITEVVEFDDYTRQRVVIQTELDVDMPIYVLIPKNGQSVHPVVIAAHGHGCGGKAAIAGITGNPEVERVIEAANCDYGVQFAKAGFITFCPDARGAGERVELFDQTGKTQDSSCKTLNHIAYSLGQTVTGMWTWDIHRLIDYIETRTDCLSTHIGCVGLSGGGLQVLWASALDTRIKCVVISGYMYGYKQSLLDEPSNCSCNYVPHLYEYVDMGDIAALIAPRPLLIETGDKDFFNGADGLENVLPQVAIIQQAYSVTNQEQLMKHDIFNGGHRWNGVESIPWMERFLK